MVYVIIVTAFIAIFFILILFRMLFWGGNRKLKEAMRLESSGKYFDALSIYDYLLKEGRSVPELRWKIANISLKINNIAKAQKELAVLIQSGIPPENVSMDEVKKLMAETYLMQGKVKEAFAELIEIFKMNPENPAVLFDLAKIYAGQRLTGRAIRLLDKCLRLNPNDYMINYYLGVSYLDFGDPDKAMEFLEKTARLRFYDNGRVNYYLGVLYFAKRQFNIAIQHFNQVLKLRPNDNRILSEAHHFIALCYKEKGLVDEAIMNFEKSQTYSELLPKDSQNKKSLYNQGVLHYKSKQYQKALEKFYKVKMLDYRYKDVDKIIREISLKLKTGGVISDNIANYINENPLMNVLKRGFLYSKTRFNIQAIESKATKLLKLVNNEGGVNSGSQETTDYTTYSNIEKFNLFSSKKFKDVARKLVQIIGYQIKSEPRFVGDDEYIDGNAINFFSVPMKNPKIKKDILITIRRYREPVPELSVSRFIDWIEDRGLEQGVFIASSTFSTQALKVIHMYPNLRFIDRVGLAKILGRMR